MADSNNPTRVQIHDRSEFLKLASLGTYYLGRDVVSTTVGVAEDEDAGDVESKRVNFVFVGE